MVFGCDFFSLSTEVFANLIASLIGAVISIFVALAIRYVRFQRPVRKMWGEFVTKRHNIVLVTVSIPTVEQKTYSVVSSPEFIVLAELLSLLKQVSKDLRIEHYPSIKFPLIKMGSSLLIIGGPNNNIASRLIFERVSLPVWFEDHKLKDIEGNCYAPLQLDGAVIRDYGVIINIVNPFDQQERVIIVAGCHAHGSNAAIRAMILPFLQRILKYIVVKDYAIIVEADVIDELVSTPKIVKIFDIPEVTLKHINDPES